MQLYGAERELISRGVSNL